MIREIILRLRINEVFHALLVEANPFSTKRRRNPIFRHIRYTRDVLKGEIFEIGEYTYGLPTVIRHGERKLKIGKFCSIASGVTILLRGDHRMELVTTYPFIVFPDDWSQAGFLKVEDVCAVSRGDIVIGNDVWIGYGVTILSGVTIGDGAVIGARAVVTRDVEPYSIAVGNPARQVKKRFDDETIHRLLEIKWWDWPPKKINENLDVVCGNNVSRMFQI